MAKGKRNKNQREADAKRRPDDVVWAKSFDSADYLDPRPGRMPRPYDKIELPDGRIHDRNAPDCFDEAERSSRRG